MSDLILTSDKCTEADIEEMNREATEQFIKNKTIIETNINKFMESALLLKREYPEMFGSIEFPKGTTAEELVPAMYARDFDEEAYKSQLQVVINFNRAIQKVADTIASQPLSC